MAELRWILLLAGLIFLAGLTAWEMRRPRQGHGDARVRPERSEPTLNNLEMEQSVAPLMPLQPGYASAPAPAWGYEEARDTRDHRYTRVPLEDPVQVELPPIEPPLVVSFDEPVLPREQEIPTLEPQQALEPVYDGVYEPLAPVNTSPPHHYVPPAEPAPAVPTLHAANEPHHAAAAQDTGQPDAEQFAESQPVADEAPGDIVLPAAEPRDPIVEWPPEEQRHILAIRVVGLNPDRMPGRPLRQALSACGFVHGRFGIFHQPGADGRALISAANLNKPGVFDPASMDFQRFRGLGLFAVLPGPLPPAAALDHLLDTAGDLAQRLHARLQDEHGMPLDEERLEAMARIVQGMTQGGLRAEPAA